MVGEGSGLGEMGLIRVLIRMVFFTQCAICSLDIPFRGRFIDIKQFVKVFGAEDQGDEREEEQCREIPHLVG